MQSSKAHIRAASHAGSWYSKDGRRVSPGHKLLAELNGWVEQAQTAVPSINFVRALIGP